MSDIVSITELCKRQQIRDLAKKHGVTAKQAAILVRERIVLGRGYERSIWYVDSKLSNQGVK